MVKKLILGLLIIIGSYNFAWAEGTETLTHFGVSVMKTLNKSLVYSAQVNGSLLPSIEREIIPYPAVWQRLYGFIGINSDANYNLGLGYYVGRIGMTGLQIGLQNIKELKEDEFIYGLYFDGNVFKTMLKNLGGMTNWVK